MKRIILPVTVPLNIELLIGQSSNEAEQRRATRLQNKALSALRTNGGYLSDIHPPEIEPEKKMEIKRDREGTPRPRLSFNNQNDFFIKKRLP